MYKGLLSPFLEHGSSVWDPQGFAFQEELKSVQKLTASLPTDDLTPLTPSGRNHHSMTFIRLIQLAHIFIKAASFHLGPNKHGLVTYIQVNVYIGNTLSWLNGG